MSGAQLTRLLERAQADDAEARDRLVRSYADWAVRVAARHCGRYLDAERDDEASIALLAVDEAVLTYRPDAGSQFTTFLAMVIKRRLIDFHRRQRRHSEVSLSSLSVPEQVPDEAEEERRHRVEEIGAFIGELREYGITLEQLVRSCPKQRDARERALVVARKIVDNPPLLESFKEQKELPLKQLAPLVEVSRKTLERQRTYVVTMVIILSGDYGFLKSYLSGTSGGMQHDQAGLGSGERAT